MSELLNDGTVPRNRRLEAAQTAAPVTAVEQLSILVQLLNDEDAEVRSAAAATLERIPDSTAAALLTGTDVPNQVRMHFVDRRQAVAPVGPVGEETHGPSPGPSSDPSLPAAGGPGSTDPSDDSLLTAEEGVDRASIHQRLTQMGIPQRVKAAMTGSREVRTILIRDPNRMISAAVLTSPKLTEAEVESFARMGNVSEDVLRIIGSNRAWMKNYGVVVALIKNAKTPLSISLTLMHRLLERDLVKLSVDRNVTDPLRVAAKRKVVNAKP
jgi:hypothetical protein